MQFWQLAMRTMLRDNGDVYLPYHFEGDNWNTGEKQTIDEAIKPHVPATVDSGFNNWIFFKGYRGAIGAKRATWNDYQWFNTADEVAAFITDMYVNRYA